MTQRHITMHKYRPDIDGLRAVAVLSVVAFHGGFEKVAPGGFVGVDIFFVISGFLISRIVYDAVQSGSFSLLSFYNRRARRILPALTAVLLFCWIAGLSVYYYPETSAIRAGTLAASLFSSNIYFSYSSGYFDQATASNPLLHTWSLSVEEQFYIVFPVFIWLMRSISYRLMIAILFLVALLSLASAAFYVHFSPISAFYLVQFRAWELLVGVLVSLWCTVPLKRDWNAELLGILGLLLIGGSIHYLDRSSTFPGLNALPSCLGAGAILFSGLKRETFVSKLLGSSLFRCVGLISYSLYLWHWPVIVFGNLIHEPRGVLDRLYILVTCLIAACISWRFVERPFRDRPYRLNEKQTLGLCGTVITCTCILALSITVVNKRIWSVPDRALAFLSVLDYKPDAAMRIGSCFLTSEYNSVASYQAEKCLSLSSLKENVLILGDSHAAHLWFGLDKQFPEVNFLQATASGCKPLLPLNGLNRCVDLMKLVFNKFLHEKRVDRIILSARWDLSDLPSLKRTVEMLRTVTDHVVVVGPVVEYSAPLPRILANATTKSADPLMFASTFERKQPRQVDSAMLRETWPSGVIYVSLYSSICSEKCLVIAKDGLPLQFDYGHFTNSGSSTIASLAGMKMLDRLQSDN